MSLKVQDSLRKRVLSILIKAAKTELWSSDGDIIQRLAEEDVRADRPRLFKLIETLEKEGLIELIRIDKNRQLVGFGVKLSTAGRNRFYYPTLHSGI